MKIFDEKVLTGIAIGVITIATIKAALTGQLLIFTGCLLMITVAIAALENEKEV